MQTNLKRVVVAAASVFFSYQAHALSIDAINVSTVAGYPDSHYPVDYPSYDRFSILGAAYSYQLSNGEVRQSGAGWIPYTNGELLSVETSNDEITYRFGRVNNWARGEGSIFYSQGQVWCPSCNEPGAGLWTEGEFAPVSPVLLKAKIGSTVATLVGTARIVFNHAGGWGSGDQYFIPFTLPEGSIVNYAATYTLLNATWNVDTFTQQFSYQMTGKINVSSVPEPTQALLLLAGLLVVGANIKGKRNIA
ncbi:hypothetical protein [Aquabacterium sp. CECT 9606]|uniref:hypothetical protein n=1 Tax=Aquabacterium sp. CECT 9606 TaxID=2845822 RepID=UPI001E41E065|nr:hypothetical protein [Aquabacterium sp. CECT 9606]CAH0349896.1 hypothetical protein AQB9606_01302 [Aquabacterium sp. CECT 9606]